MFLRSASRISAKVGLFVDEKYRFIGMSVYLIGSGFVGCKEDTFYLGKVVLPNFLSKSIVEAPGLRKGARKVRL